MKTKNRQPFQVVCFGSGRRTRTSDLRVMSPTSCQLLHPATLRVKNGAEDRNRTGTRGKSRRILSPVRLPVPPLRHSIFLEATPRFELGIKELQSTALQADGHRFEPCRPHLQETAMHAGVAELADAQDLKSCWTYLPYRFDSGRRH